MPRRGKATVARLEVRIRALDVAGVGGGQVPIMVKSPKLSRPSRTVSTRPRADQAAGVPQLRGVLRAERISRARPRHRGTWQRGAEQRAGTDRLADLVETSKEVGAGLGAQTTTSRDGSCRCVASPG